MEFSSLFMVLVIVLRMNARMHVYAAPAGVYDGQYARFCKMDRGLLNSAASVAHRLRSR